MQECHYDKKKWLRFLLALGLEFVSARMSLWYKNDQGYDTGGIGACKVQEGFHDKKMTNVMILVGLEFIFVSARRSWWQINDLK